MVAPIFDAQGELEYFLGSQVDVSKAADLEAGNTLGGARAQAARDAVALLSPRQREILVHMAAGKLNKQIAYELGLSERTVKMHRSSVIRTLGVRTSADAIRVAVEAGL
jgi:DNA-binding NarL/FixJ family response regulator